MATLNIKSRIKRHRRSRSHLAGTAERPRLAVFRSLRHISVQLINDDTNRTMISVSDSNLGKEIKGQKPIVIAKMVGKLVAEKALAAGINTVVFDRGGYIYHGRIQALADGAREQGLKF